MGNYLPRYPGYKEPSKELSKELCERMQHSFGAWLTWLPYLTPLEQISLQRMNRYAYQRGVPRVQRSIQISFTVYFPHENNIVALNSLSARCTVFDTQIDSNGWVSIQVGANIFQFQKASSNLRMIENVGSSRIRLTQKAPMIHRIVLDVTFCNMANKFLFATGGLDENGVHWGSVGRYDIARDIWEEMPLMNKARRLHGSCALGTVLYVICGISQAGRLNSIEKLETQNLQGGWQLIQMPSTSLLTTRHNIVAVAFEQSEILIMGGTTATVLTFDTRDNSIKKPANKMLFKVIGEQLYQVNPGTVFAKVLDGKGEQRVVKYERRAISVLHHF